MLAEATHAPDIAFQIEEMAVNHEVAQPHLYQHREFGLIKFIGSPHPNLYYDRETSITADDNGESHVHLELTPHERPQIPQDDQIIGRPAVSDAEPVTTEQQRTALRLMPSDINEAIETYFDKVPEGLPIVHAIGYSIDSDIPGQKTSGKADINLSNIPRTNIFLDYVRTRTGFAPNAVDYDGGEFPLRELRERLMERSFLTSNRLGIREHDKLIHTPAWCLQPVEVMQELVQRTSPNNTAALKRIDTSIDARLFVQLIAENTPEVEQIYAYLFFDASFEELATDKQNTVTTLAKTALARTKQVMLCAEEFNALQLAA